jgi:hypothetical protein
MKNRGTGLVEVIVALVALAGGFLLAKPKLLDGDSRRASKSTETTQALIEKQDERGATAAAYVVKMDEVVGTMPESPEKSFLGQAADITLANLPQANARALIEAERLKNAVLTGQVREARALYEAALNKSETLTRDLERAVAAKRRSDLALEQAAAERLGAERTRNQMILVAALAVGLFLYVKLTHLSPGALATAVNDIRRDHADPITALDSVATRTQQSAINFLARLKK